MAAESSTPFLSPRAWVHLGVSAVLFLAVVVTYGQGERVGIRELDLPDLDKDKITSIELGGKYKARLVKEGEGWTVEDPENPGAKFPAEAKLVDRALDGLDELEAGAFVTGRADKHEELELTEEKGTFVTASTTDHKTLKIVVGRFAKGGGNYIRLQDGEEVFVGKGSLAGAIRKNAKQWRKKALVDPEEKDLVELSVSVPGQPAYRMTRTPAEGEGEPGPWKLVEPATLPEGFRLDEAALGRLARSFAGLRASDFIDDKKSDADTGLDTPTVVTGKTAEGKTVKVRFGGEDDKKRLYVRVDGDEQLYVVAAYAKKNVAKELDGLRDLTFFPGLSSDKITSVRFEGPGGLVKLAKEGESWKVVQGTPSEDFDPSTVSGKLRQLAALKGQAFLGRGASAPFVAASPVTRVTLQVDGESGPRWLEFGAELPGEGEKPSNQVYAQTSDGYVYEVSKYQKTRYEKPWELFKKVAPPPGMGGMRGGMPGGGGGGGIQGLENLPPEIRRQLEQQLRQQQGR